MSNASTTVEPIAFVDGLDRHGGATAVVDERGRAWSYAQLDHRVACAAAELGTRRRLVMVEAADTVDALVWYLGTLRGGHVAFLAGSSGVEAAVDHHDPDVVVAGGPQGWMPHERRPGSGHDLHPDLALLASTSGSTGSPRLVRLSRANLAANTASIVDYLGLDAADRAITTLPMQYCYGLSVLHSHLAVGACVVLSSASVVDPCFWDAVGRHGVTNLAGVPHTFELLERSGFRDRNVASLRFLTQAGGRLDPDVVRRFADHGAAGGWDLFVMYGQTEATARMAYLPPHLARSRADAVGVAVPGGSFRLEPFDGCRPGEGEVIYAGPNVMMGYAETAADLARGPEHSELHTGDIGRFGSDGMLEIVGRRRDFVKIFGLRIDLGQIDRLLVAHGVDGRCAGDDDGIAVAVTGTADPAAVRATIATTIGLPSGAVAVAAMAELPRLATGKLDRRMLLRTVRERARVERAGGGSTAIEAGSDPSTAAVPVLAEVLCPILGIDHAGPGDTFVSLGGDSLSYVEASIVLEERLGQLPDGWHVTPLGDLTAAATATASRRAPRLETGVALRALAIVLIVANHTGLFLVGGGAHLLLAAAGFNFARFQLNSGSLWRSVARVAVPSMVWIGGVAAVTEDFDPAHALLLHGWVGGRGRWAYWFVEVLVQVLVVLAIAFAVPAVRRLERRYRFAFPAVLTLAALTIRFDLVDAGRHHRPFFRPHEIAWIFLLGWMAAQADTRRRKVVVSVVAAASVPGFFGNTTRDLVLLGGLALLLWVPRLAVPRRVPRFAGLVASASLFIYLSHIQVHPLVSDRSPLAGLVLSIVAGIAVWRATALLSIRRVLDLGRTPTGNDVSAGPGDVSGGAGSGTGRGWLSTPHCCRPTAQNRSAGRSSPPALPSSVALPPARS